MKSIFPILLLLITTSCIPVKVAPKFKNEDYKIMEAKKFQRKMPRETAFIFKDPKNADEFYQYINKKYDLNDVNVDSNVAFKIDNETFYLSYYEAERTDKSVNLPLVLVDAKREQNGNDPLFENSHVNRQGYWYLILTVNDDNLKNCLLDEHTKKPKVVKYLKELQQEYLTTYNYEELAFKKKS